MALLLCIMYCMFCHFIVPYGKSCLCLERREKRVSATWYELVYDTVITECVWETMMPSTQQVGVELNLWQIVLGKGRILTLIQNTNLIQPSWAVNINTAPSVMQYLINN